MSIEQELLILALQNKLEILIEEYSNNHSYYSNSINNYFIVLKKKYEDNTDDLNFISRLELGNCISDTDKFIHNLQIHTLKNISLIKDLFKIFDPNYKFIKD